MTIRVLTDLAALPGVTRSALALVEGGGRRLRFTSSDRLAGEDPRWCLIDAYDDVPLTAVVRSGAPVLADLEGLGPKYAGFARGQAAAGVAALAVLPIRGTRDPRGGVVVYYAEPQAFDQRQADDLRAAVEQVALRLEAADEARQEPGREVGARDGAQVASLVVEGDARAARTARQFLRGELAARRMDDELVDVAVLCVSELVTNAVLHAGTASDLTLTLDEATLTLVVRDYGGPARVEPGGDSDPLRVHGRGLQLVDALASRWGSERDEVGTTVWVQLDRAASG